MSLFSAGITQAAATYRVNGGTGASNSVNGDNYDFISTIGVPIEGGAFFNGELLEPSSFGSASSRASIFGLGASAIARAFSADTFGDPFRVYNYNSSASATATWSDFIVAGPAGPSSIPISLNLFFDGTKSTSIAQSSAINERVAATGVIGVGVDAFGGGFFTQNFSGEYATVNTKREGLSFIANGLLADFDGSSLITTPLFNVRVNVPFRLQLGVTAGVSLTARDNEIFSMEGGANFGNTLTFATSGPVFNLPGGYTINSVEAGIVDNVYVAVPEASSLWLSALSVGVTIVGAVARRRSPRALSSQVAS
jgi:hypothetical protein